MLSQKSNTMESSCGFPFGTSVVLERVAGGALSLPGINESANVLSQLLRQRVFSFIQSFPSCQEQTFRISLCFGLWLDIINGFIFRSNRLEMVLATLAYMSQWLLPVTFSFVKKKKRTPNILLSAGLFSGFFFNLI